MKWAGVWMGAAALAIMVPGCGADEQASVGSPLEQAAPLHLEIHLKWQDFLGRLEGKIHTSLLPEDPGCALQVDRLILSTGKDRYSGSVWSEEAGGGACGAAAFATSVSARSSQSLPPIQPTEILDVLEIWDDPEWKVRIEGVDIFQERGWDLWLDVEPRTRLGGHWSHPQDDLAGRIRAIWYDVSPDHDHPAKGAYRIDAKDIEVDGSYFEFTLPGLPTVSYGTFGLEVEDVPLHVTCENASCAASLSGKFYISSTILMRR